MDLAAAADAIPTSGRARRRSSSSPATRPALHWALDAVTEGIATVRNAQMDLLAANPLGRAFYSPMIGDGGRIPNRSRARPRLNACDCWRRGVLSTGRNCPR